MKILMLTPYLPYPLVSGGQIRTYNLLKHLKDKHEITLFSLIKSHDEKKHLPHLEKYCRQIRLFKRSEKPFTLKNILKAGFSSYPFVVTRNLVSETKKEVRKELQNKRYDLIHAETFYMMPNIPQPGEIPVILVEQTIEYLGYQSYAQKSKVLPIKPLLYIDINKIKSWETYYWHHCDRLITMSQDDKSYILKRHPQIKHVDVVANGVDMGFFTKTKKILPDDPTVLIIGTFKWLPNVEAVEYLVEKIWPLVRAKLPNAKLHIVGYSPTPKILGYDCANGIKVSGNVKDIRQAYSTAHVLLAPVKSGKGTRYKILEAMATKTPIVATKLAIEGIEGLEEGKHVLTGDKRSELAEQTIKLLGDTKLQSKLSKNSFELVADNYNWPRIAKDLDRIYREIGQRS